MKQREVHEVLGRIFKVIVEEAAGNRKLAQRLAEALGASGRVSVDKPTTEPRRRRSGAELHAINVLRAHGEAALRGKLEQIRSAADLRLVAKGSGLVLGAAASRAKASRAELIEAIIVAAKHYDAQRSAATAVIAPQAQATYGT
jgi:hypothetical protein